MFKPTHYLKFDTEILHQRGEGPILDWLPRGTLVESFGFIPNSEHLLLRTEEKDFVVSCLTNMVEVIMKYQPVEKYRQGKMYLFRSFDPCSILNEKGSVIGTIRDKDMVMYLGHKLWNWNLYDRVGFEFHVIFQDVSGWIGHNTWTTLEEVVYTKTRLSLVNV